MLLDIENHHNFAWKEHHFDQDVIVHRKGATPAGSNAIGIIPGSMATPAFIIKGKGKIRDKVRLPDEVNQEDYDPEYYINNQILPAVERILAVLGFSKEDFAQDKVQSTLGSFIK